MQTSAQNAPAEPIWPEVTVFHDSPTTETKAACAETNDNAFLETPCQRTFIGLQRYQQALDATGLFQGVTQADRSNPFTVAFAFATIRINKTSAEELGNAVLSGSTLLLIPMKEKSDVTAEVLVAFGGYPLKRYQYELPYERVAGLLTGDGSKKADSQLVSALTDRFIADAMRDNLFAPAEVHKNLQCSDYLQEFVVPDRIGPYTRGKTTLSTNPLEGATVTYAHNTFQDTEVNMSAYPIFRTQWRDIRGTITDEIAQSRRQLRVAADENDWEPPEFPPIDELSWQDGIACSKGRVPIGERDTVPSTACVAIREDKFIVASLAGAQLIDQAVLREAVSAVRVPKASLFMAKVRSE